jgi:hypothetical protein
MESSILSEVDDTSILRAGLPITDDPPPDMDDPCRWQAFSDAVTNGNRAPFRPSDV